MKQDDKQAAIEYEARWQKMLTSYREHQLLRDRLYGFRVEDDPHPEHAGSFVAICPIHGILGDELTILEARMIRDDHQASHAA